MSISTSPSVSSSTSPSKLPTVSKNDQLEDINTCEHINEEKMNNPVSDLIVENSQDKNILNSTNNEDDDDDKNEDLSEKYSNEKEKKMLSSTFLINDASTITNTGSCFNFSKIFGQGDNINKIPEEKSSDSLSKSDTENETINQNKLMINKNKAVEVA